MVSVVFFEADHLDRIQEGIGVSTLLVAYPQPG